MIRAVHASSARKRSSSTPSLPGRPRSSTTVSGASVLNWLRKLSAVTVMIASSPHSSAAWARNLATERSSSTSSSRRRTTARGGGGMGKDSPMAPRSRGPGLARTAAPGAAGTGAGDTKALLAEAIEGSLPGAELLDAQTVAAPGFVEAEAAALDRFHHLGLAVRHPAGGAGGRKPAFGKIAAAAACRCVGGVGHSLVLAYPALGTGNPGQRLRKDEERRLTAKPAAQLWQEGGESRRTRKRPRPIRRGLRATFALLHLRRDVGEGSVERGADALHRGDRRDGDQSGDEAVLDRGGAL